MKIIDLAIQAAREAGSAEAWFIDADGLVTEGASSNAWIVTADGVLVTRDTSANILRGVTRATLLEVARTENIRIEERAFSLEEAMTAREAFFTGAGALLTSVMGDCSRIHEAIYQTFVAYPLEMRLPA
jgi:D-alanine transaminase